VLVASGRPVALLEAINDRAITQLALPHNRIGDPRVLAGAASTRAEQANARDRLRSCFLYGADGEVPDADVETALARLAAL